MLIGGYQPFSLSDYPGRTAAIIFTQGCNFRCPYCHNKQLWATACNGSETLAEGAVLEKLSKRRKLLGGVVITGGEPTLQEDLEPFLLKIKTLGLCIKLDTNGSRPETVKSLITRNLVDYIAMDIKAPKDKYNLLAGCRVDWQGIKESITAIRGANIHHHFRTTYDRTILADSDIQKIEKLISGETLVVQNCQ